MMDQVAIPKWRKLRECWWISDQPSRNAHGEVRFALQEFTLEGGCPPLEQLKRMDALLQEA